MSDDYIEVKFGDLLLIFLGESLSGSGSLTTADAYRDGEPGYAHLTADGRVMRFKKQIGVRADLVLTGRRVHVEPTLAGVARIIFGPKWEQPN